MAVRRARARTGSPPWLAPSPPPASAGAGARPAAGSVIADGVAGAAINLAAVTS